MNKVEFDVVKGHQDWWGREARIRNVIRDGLRGVFERYGYQPLETPVIENKETLAFKGGGEIQKEVYQLTDQGGRELGLRFDQTVPFARFLAMHKELSLPFKRYVIGPVFRDGPAQPEQGRFRSFTQCDVDIAGLRDMTAEAELLALAEDAFKEFGLGGAEIYVNNRKLLDGILDAAQVPQDGRTQVIVELDKLDKIGVEGVTESLTSLQQGADRVLSTDLCRDIYRSAQEGVEAEQLLREYDSRIRQEIGQRGCKDVAGIIEDNISSPALMAELSGYRPDGVDLLTPNQVDRIMGMAMTDGDNARILESLSQHVTSDLGREGIKEVDAMLTYAADQGIGSIVLQPSLARGLAYYTGTTLEVFLQDRSIIKSAVVGGGRYDNMIGDFRQSGEEIPAVGFSFGLERLAMALDGVLDVSASPATIYLVPTSENEITGTLGIARKLRNEGLNVDIELQPGRSVGKAIGTADKSAIPYVGIVGTTELENGTVAVKDLKSGNQTQVAVDSVREYIQS